MGKSSSPDLKRLLPAVVLATFYVALAPLLVVWELRAAGVVHSSVLSILGVLALSLLASSVGSEWWKKRQGSHDVLFGDLIAWSWIRRWRLERRLDEARTLLEGTPDRGVDPASQARLLQALASTLEGRDPYTHGHSRRVARFSVLIAKRMGLPEEMVAKVRTAAAVHDVGKLKVSREVLNKPGKLTDEEFALIQRHAEYSARMVERLGDEQITAIVRHHHERLDGTGYPDRLAGEDVPVGSRIIAVADTFDALTSKRPYRPSKSHKAAMDILAREAGTQLDPEAVRAFRGYYSGRRALTLWNGATLLPERLLSALSTVLHAGGVASSAQLLTAAAASTIIGGTAVLSATPTTSAADRASRPPAAVVSVDANVPGVQPESRVSIPTLVARDRTRAKTDDHRRSASFAAGPHRPGSRPPQPSAGSPAGAGQGASPPSGPAAGGSRTPGEGSGGSSTGAPIPALPAAGGGAAPKLPDVSGSLPAAPSGGGLVPGAPPTGGGLLPTVPSGGGLIPRASSLPANGDAGAPIDRVAP